MYQSLIVNRDALNVIMAFSKFVKRHSFWSKDIIFLVTDKGHHGTQAWLEAYHGNMPSPGIKFDQLQNYAGLIVSAINLELPGNGNYASFSINPS